MAATRVGPHGWEGDFLVCSFLEKESAVRGPEEENTECAVEETLVDVGHEVAYGPSERADRSEWSE